MGNFGQLNCGLSGLAVGEGQDLVAPNDLLSFVKQLDREAEFLVDVGEANAISVQPLLFG